LIENLSPNILIFPTNYGARGFSYNIESKSWVEADNNINFYPETGIGLIPIDNGITSIGIVSFSPDFGESDPPSTIRIIVIGNPVIDDEISEIEYAAYIDVTLSPEE